MEEVLNDKDKGMEVDDGAGAVVVPAAACEGVVSRESSGRGQGVSGVAVQVLLSSLKAALSMPDPERRRATSEAQELFVQQRVLAGCPKPDALREVREHHSKFLDMVAKTYSSVGGPWAHGSARREAQLDTKGS